MHFGLLAINQAVSNASGMTATPSLLWQAREPVKMIPT
jgi:hypothetical protein